MGEAAASLLAARESPRFPNASLTAREGSPEFDDCLACISRESVDLTIDVAFGDLDGDGYTLCEDDDCCELGDSCGTDPEDVNPGALDVIANGVDDDCFAGDAVAPVTCSLGADYAATGLTMVNAMEICESTTPDGAECGSSGLPLDANNFSWSTLDAPVATVPKGF